MGKGRRGRGRGGSLWRVWFGAWGLGLWYPDGHSSCQLQSLGIIVFYPGFLQLGSHAKFILERAHGTQKYIELEVGSFSRVRVYL